MSLSALLASIGEKDADAEMRADEVIDNPDLLAEIFAGLNADKAHIKYGLEKILRLVSDKKPELLYPRIDFFINNLDSDNFFFKLGAIYVLANLAKVDADKKIEAVFDKYFAPIPGPALIPAANVIAGAAKIVAAKPALIEKITDALLKVEKARYQTEECRNIAIGKAITTFDSFFADLEDKKPVIDLVKNQLGNTRNATRKRAEAFIKKYKLAVA